MQFERQDPFWFVVVQRTGGLVLLVMLLFAAWSIWSDWRTARYDQLVQEFLPPELRTAERLYDISACIGCGLPSGASVHLAIWELPDEHLSNLINNGLDYLRSFEKARSVGREQSSLWERTQQEANCHIPSELVFRKGFNIEPETWAVDLAHAGACSSGNFIWKSTQASLIILPDQQRIVYVHLDPT